MEKSSVVPVLQFEESRVFGFVSSKVQGVGVLVLRINALKFALRICFEGLRVWGFRSPGVETLGSMDLRV